MRAFLIVLVCLGVFCVTAASVFAQAQPQPQSQSQQQAAETKTPAPTVQTSQPATYEPKDYAPRSAMTSDGKVEVTEGLDMRSLLFKPEEVRLLVQSMGEKLGDAAALAGAGDLGQALSSGLAPPKPVYPAIPLKRVISLSGVAYRAPNDWVVWLNGHKLVPGVKLPEIVDMKVDRDRVALKWFDIGLGKIIVITLRPYQTYDVVSGVLLSGPSAGQQP